MKNEQQVAKIYILIQAYRTNCTAEKRPKARKQIEILKN